MYDKIKLGHLQLPNADTGVQMENVPISIGLNLKEPICYGESCIKEMMEDLHQQNFTKGKEIMTTTTQVNQVKFKDSFLNKMK